jgi:DNA-binding CsgD family transcriptional regulator/PAS domain-containing protein
MNSTDNGLIGPLQSYYDFLHEGILLLNTDHETVYCNPSAKKILCLKKERGLNKAADHLIMEPSLDSDNFIAALLREKKIHQTIQLKTCDNQYLEASLFCSCIQDDVTGEYLGQLVFFQDPFSVKESREQFNQRAQLLNALNGCTSEIIFILDLKGRTNVFVNDAMSDLLGWNAGDFINGGWPFTLSVIHPDDLKEIRKKCETDPFYGMKFQECIDAFSHSIRVRSNDGRWMSLNLNGNILEHDANGRPYLLLLFIKPDVLTHTGIRFTQREMEIARQLVRGQSSKMIAAMFRLSVHTVNDYRTQLLKKTGTTNTAALVNYLIERRLV